MSEERTMPEEIVEQLVAAGFNRYQATSATAKKLVEVLQSDDSKILVQETKRQVEAMQKIVEEAQKEHQRLTEEIGRLSTALLAIGEAQEKYGEVTDKKARDCVALYGKLLGMSIRAGASENEAVNNASYMVYAYLSKQEKRKFNTKAVRKLRSKSIGLKSYGNALHKGKKEMR